MTNFLVNFLGVRRLESVSWLPVVSGWVLGVIVARERVLGIGDDGIFAELSKAVSVPEPLDIGAWWEVIAYFTLTTLAIFALSHLFFGIGGGVFMFARGVHDNFLIVYLETTIGAWSISRTPMSKVLTVLFILLILGANLPLCIWSGKLGVQRSLYTLHRLRKEPIKPEVGSKPFSYMLMIVAASLVVGLIATVVFSHL
ncbi:hypothetical protein AKJ64_02345 [candidate division MSBL1 archaeon SCGC-AAA259E17]|uniref:Uncharacterized protein n=1 Tax=candidate division MSBL1 archaeon SCGC-AAA259E17 TaxID=1698263 RepID=A0A133UF64_9EURY|nr:hypothetical protein AKJ64_02345 [candidate division MSBL1 archaeon SCGC-AAA259E17]